MYPDFKELLSEFNAHQVKYLTAPRRAGDRAPGALRVGELTFGSGRDAPAHSEQTATELVVLAAEIDPLPDRTGFLRFASQPGWMRVEFLVYETEKGSVPFVSIGQPEPRHASS